jgi:LAS superfamily LD-carboxypeptidase LdcB
MRNILLIFSLLLSLCSCSQTQQKQDSIIKIDPENLSVSNAIDSTITTNELIPIKYLLGNFIPEKDSLFVQVPRKYCLLRVEYIHKDVLQPFILMYEAAALEGINLGIISAVRTFNTQKYLWEQRFFQSNNPNAVSKSILSYLAMPGTSRHHWGTDLDLMSLKLNYFSSPTGQKAYNWLLANAANYGFYQVYTVGRSTGYNEEKWHWSYLPIAKEFQNQYKLKVTYSDISGFRGCETAKNLNVIESYVFGINPELMK